MPAINPIVRADFPSALDKALYLGLMQEPSGIKPYRMDFFNLKTSNQGQEKFSQNSGFTTFGTKPEGGSAQPDGASEMYYKFIYMVTYAKRIDITMEALQDDPKGIKRKLWQTGEELASNWNYTLEQLHWYYLVARWSTATAAVNLYTYPQGSASYYPIFDLAHPTAEPGITYANRFENSVQLNRASLEAAITSMEQNNLNPAGMLYGWEPRTLLVGRSNLPTALRLLQNYGVPESADNGKNVITDWINRCIAPNLFADDGRWAIAAEKSKLKFYTFDRMGLETQTLSQNDTLNNTRVAAARTGYGGVTPEGLFGALPA